MIKENEDYNKIIQKDERESKIKTLTFSYCICINSCRVMHTQTLTNLYIDMVIVILARKHSTYLDQAASALVS